MRAKEKRQRKKLKINKVRKNKEGIKKMERREKEGKKD